MRLCLSVGCLGVFLFVLSGRAVAPAQKKSVKPGINKAFQNPDVQTFRKRFEREGRDVYDKRHEILKACRIKRGMRIADIGAGTGLFTRLFSEAVGPQGKVYAVDIAPNFIRHIQQMARREGRRNIISIVCTQQSTKLPPHSVDLVFLCDTYHHFEFPHKTLRTIHRALVPGGQLILIDFHRIPGKSSDWVLGHVRAGQKVFVGEIARAGFRQVEERKDLLASNYFVRFVKVPARQP